MKLTTSLLMILCLGVPLAAQTPEYDRVLIPIAIGRVPGAHGSLWTSELWVSNGAISVRDFNGNQYCATLCPPNALQPGATRGVPFFPQPSNAPGLLVYVERPSGEVTFNSRIQDLSRQAQTWGTEIQVVREEDFLTSAARLLNVPSGNDFRITLRIYDLDARPDARIHLRAFRPHSTENLGTTEILLETPPPGTVRPQYKPGYAQVSDLEALFPAITGHPRIGLEITPLTPGLRYWAFVSITNNETQHVTTVTPQ